MNRKWGWKRPLPDQRDFLFAAISPRIKLPMVVYLLCPPIQDQGAEGSCVFNAITTDMEFIDIVRGDDEEYEMFSRQFAYYNYRKWLADVTEDPSVVQQDTGASIRDAVKLVAKMGVCRESLWPYIPMDAPDTNFATEPSDEAKEDAKNHKIKSYYAVKTVDDMQQCLAAGFGFLGGVAVYDSFMSPEVTATGIIPMPSKNERLLGGHAIWIWGYDRHKKIFKGQNSWGEDWGQKGHFEIPFDYLGNPALADDFWTIRTIIAK